MTKNLSPSTAPEPDEQFGEEDFAAFWRDATAGEVRETKTIFGVTVEVPTDLPLNFENLVEAMGKSSKEEDVKKLVGILFGQDVLDTWKARGCTGRQFQVLFMWGYANGQGKPTTFAEAKQLADEAAAADAEGKAAPVPNRADRRAKASSATRASGAAGRSSSRTSSASTASRRRTSPA
ncbi:hypothetical protein [Saccharothrix sp. HUAS TT1]|uniref:hypothetical protein n=1 Tax=unclassified Saccharothrix TaxID=2593673 RepID=UPI00345BF543